jgi:predicted DNA-binding transcriptional regulator AlpA
MFVLQPIWRTNMSETSMVVVMAREPKEAAVSPEPEEEARRKAEEEARRKAEEEARRVAAARKAAAEAAAEAEAKAKRRAEATTLPKKLLKSAAVKERLGDISSQTLWRYGRDPALEFPKPIYIYGTRYWVSGEIDDFIERQRGDE